ncbi:MAG: UDP-N-acetylmuramoyl-tripeptide--D-alanyl-D-alanine ligase [Actinobacteria bacterium]|nr:UDP-N-acetylmuramoyl-tripeptide--D-alanyl-D-alanine ligase [Actinomycetota bacterium]
MNPRMPSQVATDVHGHLIGAARDRGPVNGCAIDSRRVRPGDLFVALSGGHVDGHHYIGEAFARGAAAALVRRGGWARSRDAPAGPIVEVDDPARALLDLARAERGRLSATVIAVTGSTGKTCTKDFTAAVLGRRLRVTASPASFNNEVGLPLTILAADGTTQAVVCEMGSRGRGHIRALCEIARPQVGVVTNVGLAHLELFGSLEALHAAKAELPQALPAGGTAVLNADDPVVRGYADSTDADVVRFGLGHDAVVRAEALALEERTGRSRFRLETPDGRATVHLPVPGEHMVANALAAAAVGWVLGVPVEESAAGLAAAQVGGSRMEVFETPAGLRIVNDAYNANPASMAAALKAARWMAGDGRCIAVLGPMAELGPDSADHHERLGELLVRLGIDGLVTVGDRARRIAVGAEREGLEPERIVTCGDSDEAVEALRTFLGPRDLVLVKASRAAHLDRVAKALRDRSTSATPGDAATSDPAAGARAPAGKRAS